MKPPLLRQFSAKLLLLVPLVLLAAACSSSSAIASTAGGDSGSTRVAGTTAPPSAATTPSTTAAPSPTSAALATPTTTEAPTAAYDFAAISPIVEAFIAEKNLNGAGLIIVHRDDGVIHHEHWGEFSEDRISLIASSSKMISSGVLLRLQDDGLLDINTPVAAVADWGAGNPDVTPAQLVSNSSGLVGLLPNPAYGPYRCQYIPSGDLEDCAASIFTTDSDDSDITPPDTAFNYGGAQWQVAGGVAEAASGKSWAELINEIYVVPCDLEVLAYNNHFSLIGEGWVHPREFNSDPSILPATDNPNIEGGAYVTTGDYGKLLLMHLRDGMCGDTKVLSPEALDTMHSDRLATAYDGDAWSETTGYGMGWWVDRPSGRISDGGAYGSVPWLDLDDGYGAFLVIEATSQLGNELADQLYEPVDAAITKGSQ